MSTPSRTLAVLSYVLPLAGPAAALASRRDDLFVRYHAAQGLAIDAGAIGAPLVWAVVGWLLAWVPRIGLLMGLTLFGLVLAVELLLLAARVIGVVWALRGEMRPALLVGGLAERAALAEEPAPGPLSPVAPEALEATAEQAPVAETSSTK